MKKKLRLVLIAVLVMGVLVWLAGEISLPSAGPPAEKPVAILSPQGDGLLRGACFDCHSNETRLPWYAHLPGVGIMMGWHVREGREKLNFSRWETAGAARRREWLQESLETLREGEMPTAAYRWLHPEARLTPPQVAFLEREVAARYGVVPGRDRERGEHKGRRNRRDDDD